MAGKVAAILLGFSLLAMSGCGSVPTGALGDDSAQAVLARGEGGECDPFRSLRLELVFDGAVLERDLDILGLRRHDALPSFEAELVGIDPSYQDALVSRIVELVRQAYGPFGIDVAATIGSVDLADATLAPDAGLLDGEVGAAVPVETVSRVIVTQVEGAPKVCRCQGATAELGLNDGGTAEGVVLANAFRDNGLAAALQRWPAHERIEMAASAIANSVVHEAGHTFGLVHLDVPGAPTLFMARGGSAATILSVAEMTTFQSFSSEALPVTSDALGVRDVQCDSCLLHEIIEQRRSCGASRATR
ncbi:MAG: hypothetical protein C4547_13285 [Phycisphaerales bacterium]|nr:MAG: hypothetical protein C4547_13285 [Phycisphaerales bacterium]